MLNVARRSTAACCVCMTLLASDGTQRLLMRRPFRFPNWVPPLFLHRPRAGPSESVNKSSFVVWAMPHRGSSNASAVVLVRELFQRTCSAEPQSWASRAFAIARLSPLPRVAADEGGRVASRPSLAMQSERSSDSSSGLRTVTSCDGAIQLAAADNAHLYLGLLPRDVRAEVDRHLYAFLWHHRGVLVPAGTLPRERTYDDLPDFAVKRDGQYVIVVRLRARAGEEVRFPSDRAFSLSFPR